MGLWSAIWTTKICFSQTPRASLLFLRTHHLLLVCASRTISSLKSRHRYCCIYSHQAFQSISSGMATLLLILKHCRSIWEDCTASPTSLLKLHNIQAKYLKRYRSALIIGALFSMNKARRSSVIRNWSSNLENGSLFTSTPSPDNWKGSVDRWSMIQKE